MRIFSSFHGDKKIGQSLLEPFEDKLSNALVPRVPLWLETNHLTLLTIPWCLGIISFSFLAREHIEWLWVVSFLIVCQYITDRLDGAVGRYRNTGLVKWGYYMDHFLDYFFLCSILIGYFFILPDAFLYMHFFLLAIFGGYMVHSFLAFTVTNKFQVSYLGIGPTEVRLVFIMVNTLLIFFGTTHLSFLLPYILGAATLGLIVLVYRTQKVIWAMDVASRTSTPASRSQP